MVGKKVPGVVATSPLCCTFTDSLLSCLTCLCPSYYKLVARSMKRQPQLKSRKNERFGGAARSERAYTDVLANQNRAFSSRCPPVSGAPLENHPRDRDRPTGDKLEHALVGQAAGTIR